MFLIEKSYNLHTFAVKIDFCEAILEIWPVFVSDTLHACAVVVPTYCRHCSNFLLILYSFALQFYRVHTGTERVVPGS